MTLRVLHIDDDARFAELVAKYLSQNGITVLRAEDGGRGLAALDGTIDAVLLDVMMPGLDGPATLAQLRTIPAVTTLPVVFLTAKAYPREVEALRALGAVGVLPKPFDPATLGEALRRIYATTGGGGG